MAKDLAQLVYKIAGYDGKDPDPIPISAFKRCIRAQSEQSEILKLIFLLKNLDAVETTFGMQQ